MRSATLSSVVRISKTILRPGLLRWTLILVALAFLNRPGVEPVSARRQPEPKQQPISSHQEEMTIDDAFAKVAELYPDFGGASVDVERRMLSVHSREPNASGVIAAEQALKSVFGADLPPYQIELIKGDYSFLELKGWYDLLWPAVMKIPGVVRTDIDESKNRLAVGVQSLLISCALEEQMTKHGIPRAAVDIEEEAPFELHTRLSDIPAVRNPGHFHDPLVGGLEIAMTSPSPPPLCTFTGGPARGTCTLGVIAERRDPATGATTSGFVTAAHCTACVGEVEGTLFYHARVWASRLVGREDRDPGTFRVAPCPGGPCRRSDSVFVKREAHATAMLGHVARPRTTGTAAWNGADTFRIVRKGTPLTMFMGDPVEKVGKVTGWTRGRLTGTCVNVVRPLGYYETFICQGQADYADASGDSGAPVFKIVNTPRANDIILLGIHTAIRADGSRAFSPIGQIERTDELGSLRTCAPGFVC